MDDSPPERPLRVILAVEGTRGDVHPLLALAVCLRERGHDVLLCASPDAGPDAQRRGVPFQAVGRDVRAFLEDRAGLIAQKGLTGWRALREMNAYVRDAAVAQLEAMAELVPGADRVIAAGVQVGAQVVARACGIPHRTVLYCPALLVSSEHAPPVLPRAELPGGLNRIAWLAMLAAFRRLGRSVTKAPCARLGLPRVDDFYALTLSPRPVLAADRLLAPAPADARLAVEQVPCLHPLEGWSDEPLPAKLESFLEQGPPPVYLGFGSMTDPDAAATTRTALEAARRAGCRALVSRGWAGLGEGALPSDAMVVGPVNHARLFPRTAAVVHHGGAGTTTTAARAGVPQVVVPHLLDQTYWAGRVERLGLGGPAVPRRRLAVGRLARSLREALENEIVRERAADLGRRMREEAAAAPPAWSWVERPPDVPGR